MNSLGFSFLVTGEKYKKRDTAFKLPRIFPKSVGDPSTQTTVPDSVEQHGTWHLRSPSYTGILKKTA